MTKNRTTTTKNKKDVKPGLFARWWAALTGVTARVVVAVCIAILLLFVASSLVSFVSSGGADSSVVEAGSGVDLNSVDNGVQSCTGSLGMRIAMYLMNGCFGWAAFALFPFFVALIVKLVGWRSPRLSKWFIGSVFGAIWGSI